MYRILDLDNCISDDGWRIKNIWWQHGNPLRYQEYHTLAAYDSFRNAHLVRDAAQQRERIIVMTGRPAMFRASTVEWLRRNGIGFEHILMRNDDDHRPSVDVKKTQLDWLHGLYSVKVSEITSAYDDRPEICDMYMDNGIHNANVVRIHDLCAYTNPLKKEPT